MLSPKFSEEQFIGLVFDSFHGIPTYISVGILVSFFLGAVLFIALLGTKKGIRWTAGLLLVEYLLVLLLLAVLLRAVQATRLFDITPFWSYSAIKEGNAYLLQQVILNVVAFIPVGLLLGCAFSKMKWWKVLLIGLAFSLLIEVLQFLLKRGFAEVDDVFHNVVGCIVGYGIYVGIAFLIRDHQKEIASR